MTKKTEHTPTPWEVTSEGHEPNRVKIVEKGGTIGLALAFGDTDKEAEANAAFIVRACNAHDELVNFLETVALGNTDADRLAEIAVGLLKKVK